MQMLFNDALMFLKDRNLSPVFIEINLLVTFRTEYHPFCSSIGHVQRHLNGLAAKTA
jgi:hypothetical protein